MPLEFLESWKLAWRKLPDIRLPFHSKDVTSYAVHSGEHRLLVSTQDSTIFYNTVDVLMGSSYHFQWINDIKFYKILI